MIRQQRVSRSVTFIEAIACKLVDQIEQLACFDGINLMMLCTARNKGRALIIHFLLVFFAHRAAQQIGAAQ